MPLPRPPVGGSEFGPEFQSRGKSGQVGGSSAGSRQESGSPDRLPLLRRISGSAGVRISSSAGSPDRQESGSPAPPLLESWRLCVGVLAPVRGSPRLGARVGVLACARRSPPPWSLAWESSPWSSRVSPRLCSSVLRLCSSVLRLCSTESSPWSSRGSPGACARRSPRLGARV